MKKITEEDILEIHDSIVDRFNITSGTINKSTLSAIVQRIDIKFSNGYSPYDDVFSRAAALLEGIIRLHPFADGNKRTALLTMVFYLKLEGYTIILPLNTVRYSVNIAKQDDPNSEKLLKEITLWIKTHSGKTSQELNRKFSIYIGIPCAFYGFLAKIGFRKYVTRKISNWMAFDIYPEYENEVDDIMDFILDILKFSINPFEKKS